MAEIEERVREVLAGILPRVTVVAAAKTRAPDEIRAALAGGIRVVGENYVQEAEAAQNALGRGAAEWHLIGALQRNKARDAVRLFDLIQTVDSLRLAEKLDAEGRKIGRVVPILIEVNSGREPEKAGVLPEDVEGLARAIAGLSSIEVRGLMTLGPALAEPGALRPFFAETKRRLDALARLELPNARMTILSMGMSDSYREAIEEGATMVRLGTALFGLRGEDG
ncbi:MAG: YggS family pyridoxal phosphate-dependent enzyme [Candidatus Bipolaricaulota bacterium]|nr:YggS family pyridoxal phosphate-dependent enzyme [Candidatus Bipolaricaulota bacterium]